MLGSKRETDIADRHLECQEAMEIVVNSVVDVALRVGWTELEACMTIQELMDNRTLSSQANEQTNQQIQAQLSRYFNRKPRDS